MHRPIELPSRLALVGAGASATVVRSAIVAPKSSVQDWPRYSLTSQKVEPQPLLAVFFSNSTTGVQLRAMTVDAGLSPLQRSFSNTACGEGTGSDAVDPGFAVCRFLQFGLLLQSATDVFVGDVVITNASRGVYVHNGTEILLRDSAFVGNGFGSQTSDTISGCANVTVINCSFRASLGHGLFVGQSTDVKLRDSYAVNNMWHGFRLANSTGLSLDNVTVSRNGKCGVELLNLQSFNMSGGVISHNACTGQGGLCIAGPTTRDGTVSKLAVVGNGGNIVGSGAQNLTFVDIVCDMVLYKNKAWALDCAGCDLRNVSCNGGRSQKQIPVHATWPELSNHRASIGGGAGSFFEDCLIKPGEPIQPKIDALVSKAGGGKCLLAAGVHEISAPVVVPSNVELAGQGAKQSVHATGCLLSYLLCVQISTISCSYPSTH
eukprot:COSAG02_NODE_2743_length_8115_cov_5.631487_2_plen_433_part_00